MNVNAMVVYPDLFTQIVIALVYSVPDQFNEFSVYGVWQLGLF